MSATTAAQRLAALPPGREGAAEPRTPAAAGPPLVLMLSSAHPPTDLRIVGKEGAALAEAGYEVMHLCPAPDDGSPVPRTAGGVTIRTYAAPRGWLGRYLGIRALARRAAAELPDVVHAHEPDSWAAAIRVARRSGAYAVLDVHEHYPTRLDAKVPRLFRGLARWLVKRRMRAMARRADAVIVAKDGLADAFPKVDDIVPVRNYAVPVAVAPRTHREGPVTLVHLGALTRARGSMEMLRTLRLLPAARLLLIGRITDGSDEDFRKATVNLGVADRVTGYTWMPHAEAVRAVAAEGDIGLVLFQPGVENHRLALPHKLFDCMVAGIPVIVPSFAEEVAEAVREANCGLLVDSADPKAIAAAVERLSDPALRAELGANGRRAALGRFAWSTEAERLVKLYRELVPLPDSVAPRRRPMAAPVPETMTFGEPVVEWLPRETAAGDRPAGGPGVVTEADPAPPGDASGRPAPMADLPVAVRAAEPDARPALPAAPVAPVRDAPSRPPGVEPMGVTIAAPVAAAPALVAPVVPRTIPAAVPAVGAEAPVLPTAAGRPPEAVRPPDPEATGLGAAGDPGAHLPPRVAASPAVPAARLGLLASLDEAMGTPSAPPPRLFPAEAGPPPVPARPRGRDEGAVPSLLAALDGMMRAPSPEPLPSPDRGGAVPARPVPPASAVEVTAASRPPQDTAISGAAGIVPPATAAGDGGPPAGAASDATMSRPTPDGAPGPSAAVAIPMRGTEPATAPAVPMAPPGRAADGVPRLLAESGLSTAGGIPDRIAAFLAAPPPSAEEGASAGPLRLLNAAARHVPFAPRDAERDPGAWKMLRAAEGAKRVREPAGPPPAA